MRTTLITLFLIIFISPFFAKAQDPGLFFPEKELISVGIYYYPEHWDSTQWERDIKKIAEMGFEFVHLAEFAWSKMEPVEGQYNFEWLDKVVELCVKNDLKILMCTPSATSPTWMRVKYPETYVMNGNYIRGEHGTRGLHSIVNKKYRSFVENIVVKMAEKYGKNPNVIGWQLDNEPDAKPDYSASSQEAFRQWVKTKYKTIDALNIAWGNAFWSMWYNTFDQVIIPNKTLVPWWGSNPSALLDFKRYAADAQAEFLDFQAAILRQRIIPSQYITTNYMSVSPGANPFLTKNLDFATYTAYPSGGSSHIGEKGFRMGSISTIGFAADLFKSVNGVTGIMELQPGSVNWASVNSLLFPGTVHMWLWHTYATGSSLVCSYRFRQINYGTEQYHSGIIKPDGVTPSPGGENYVQFIEELKELRKIYRVKETTPKRLTRRKTAILWNNENFWSLDQQKQTNQWDAYGFPIKYQEVLHSLGVPVDIINESTDLTLYDFVIIPAYELVDSMVVERWTDYVNKGGNLIITCRTATKNRFGHFWEGDMAAPIIDLIGARIIETDMLPGHVKGEITMQADTYYWNNWGDLLEPQQGTEVLANYGNQFYKGTPAVTRNKLGKGNVIYIGVDTDDSKLEKRVLEKMYSQAGVSTEDYPEGISVNFRDGFFIAVNYSSESYSMPLNKKAKILIGEKTLDPAGVLVWQE